MSINARKNNHIEVCLREDVRSKTSNGFEKYRLVHNALPECDFDSFRTDVSFLNKTIAAPLMISSMTGGTEQGERINRNLLEAAAALNLPFAIGSQRIYIGRENNSLSHYREIAKNIPILANLGAVQLNYGYGRDECLKAVDMIRADALILHLNPLQELIQSGGDTNFSGLLHKIEALCSDFPVPVIVKEVGWGIGKNAARLLTDAGVSMIDVAGAGGTSWSQVESLINGSEDILSLAAPFADWGIPTAECIRQIHEMDSSIQIIASGGITNGVEAAKAVMLGAQIAGMASCLLPAAAKKDPERVYKKLQTIIQQYKIARFLSNEIAECV